MAERTMVGKVTHYFDRIGVAALSLKGAVKVGDLLEIEGHEGKLSQKVTSMQINHKEVSACKAGDDVAIKVDGKVREGDTVYKVS